MEKTLKEARAALAHAVVESARECGGWPGEAVGEINDASREIIHAMKREHGEVWLGRVNLHGEERGKKECALWRWDGSLVCNFGADFATPRFDEELLRLIMERDVSMQPYTAAANWATLQRVSKRLHEIGGADLFWT